MIEEKIQNDTTYLVEKVPFLYNYISDSGAIKFIKNYQLMVSKPSRFNDPYDCLTDLIKFQTFPEEFTNHKNFNEKELRNYLRFKYFPKLINSTGVSCFSETGTNMLMWSHYSNSHKGICVAYDLKKLYFTLKSFNSLDKCDSTLIKINYSRNFDPIDLFSDHKTALYNWLSTKSECWEYEQEVRITFYSFPFAPNEEMKLINFDRAAIKKIFLGSKISQVNQELIISKIIKSGLDIEIYKMERKENSFDLVPKLIEV